VRLTDKFVFDGMMHSCGQKSVSDSDDVSCVCGRELELDEALCWACNSSAVAKLELEVERASREKSVRASKRTQQEAELVDDRNYDFTGDSDDDEEKDSAVVDEPAAASASSTLSVKKQGDKRKATGNVPADADLAIPVSKVSKAEKSATAATTSRSAAAAATSTANRRSRLEHVQQER
jgi:hypothetical protein